MVRPTAIALATTKVRKITTDQGVGIKVAHAVGRQAVGTHAVRTHAAGRANSRVEDALQAATMLTDVMQVGIQAVVMATTNLVIMAVQIRTVGEAIIKAVMRVRKQIIITQVIKSVIRI